MEGGQGEVVVTFESFLLYIYIHLERRSANNLQRDLQLRSSMLQSTLYGMQSSPQLLGYCSPKVQFMTQILTHPEGSLPMACKTLTCTEQHF